MTSSSVDSISTPVVSEFEADEEASSQEIISDLNDSICRLCAPLDFEHVGFHSQADYQGNGYFVQREYSAIVASSDRCILCRKVVELAAEASATVTGHGEYSIQLSRAGVRIALETDRHILMATDVSDAAQGKGYSDRVRISLAVPTTEGKTKHWTFFLQRIRDVSSFSYGSEAASNRGDHVHLAGRLPYDGRSRPLIANMSLFRSWKDMCMQHHGEKCSQIFRNSTQILPRVIDVHRRCLTWVKKDESWVCLSYVWGKKKVLTLTTDNEAELLKEGSLTADKLPNVVDDALQVIAGLGERYLWVDSLCIKQNDSADKSLFIANMDAIYMLASVVIVAATCTDASSLLPGVRPSSRQLHPEPFNVRGVSLLRSLDPFLDVEVDLRTGRAMNYLGNPLWSNRAWTLQERFLASRSLVFTQEQIFWECEEAFWCEDSCREFPHILPDPDRTSLCAGELGLSWTSDVPSFDRYYRTLLEDYSSRALTFESDGLNAFSGVIRAFQNTMKIDFFWGMPVAYLESALAWGHQDQSLRRREGHTGPDPSANSHFPSWSWCGWVGNGTTRLRNQNLVTEALGLAFYRLSDDGLQMAELGQSTRYNRDVDVLGKGSMMRDRSQRPVEVGLEALKQVSLPIRSLLLCFWTACVTVNVTMSVADLAEHRWEISFSHEGKTIPVSWSHMMHFNAIDTVDLVAIAQNRGVWDDGDGTNGAVGVMAVTTKNGIASRKGFAWLAIRDWWSLSHREWKLVILG